MVDQRPRIPPQNENFLCSIAVNDTGERLATKAVGTNHKLCGTSFLASTLGIAPGSKVQQLAPPTSIFTLISHTGGAAYSPGLRWPIGKAGLRHERARLHQLRSTSGH